MKLPLRLGCSDEIPQGESPPLRGFSFLASGHAKGGAGLLRRRRGALSASASRLRRQSRLHRAQKDRAENRVIHNPGNPCTNERQGGNKARSRVSTSISAPEGQRLSFPSPVRESMALDRVCRSPTRQVGRPSFWERPSRAPPDRKVLPREV